MFKVVVWLLVLGAFLYGGLLVPSAPYPASSAATEVNPLPLPADLPAPVERFFRKIYGNQVPQIQTAEITGLAHLRLGGIRFPARFRFLHRTGYGYRHDMEVTWYGIRIMTVKEVYAHGQGRMELPSGVTEKEPKVNQGANLALWAEAIWFPALWVTDPRVKWEPVDASTALLRVPFEDQTETFVVRFDPGSGLLTLMESMRYKAADSPSRTLWLNESVQWEPLNGQLFPTVGKVIWFDDRVPWAQFRVQHVKFNLSFAGGPGAEL
ncbi:DUF6544 family protein [Deinococcus cellulosilyticus]|uniref:Uncharacterized protein n=1 Tax=Deinococcus cellulosilyticus (strain DSM 18568 / NBRC 106333 / KACC 11606 / 5516J-15) TaxID=1223518 RepID=A0A511MVU2_DEIC1|nr:DUF6544 family protein [Deinococcus cellulosilyticus]GEM44521.1 hypothetical protein DC3_01560 [Deinococcus cellulosilyticus NBRC 106333 = KACC 11606]